MSVLKEQNRYRGNNIELNSIIPSDNDETISRSYHAILTVLGRNWIVYENNTFFFVNRMFSWEEFLFTVDEDVQLINLQLILYFKMLFLHVLHTSIAGLFPQGFPLIVLCTNGKHLVKQLSKNFKQIKALPVLNLLSSVSSSVLAESCYPYQLVWKGSFQPTSAMPMKQ